jgi:hypothetical protein
VLGGIELKKVDSINEKIMQYLCEGSIKIPKFLKDMLIELIKENRQ